MNNSDDFIPVSKPYLTAEAKTLVLDCLETGWISSKGAYVERLEHEFAAYLGVPYAISVSSGTAALHLALLALGIGPGDEVIVPDLTFAATANAVLHCGAKPVLCSVNWQDWTLDPTDIARCLSHATKAIIPVHLYGMPARMAELQVIAKQHQLFLIEDCAESLGASIGQQATGSIGDLGCFSFFANKLITTGEGGMVTTHCDQLAQRVRCLRDHGMLPERRYWHELAGLNYRMTNIQAALGVSQLQHLDAFYQQRQQQEQWYQQYLAGVPGLEFKLQRQGVKTVNWLMSLRVDPAKAGFHAAELMYDLQQHQIETRGFFYPLHLQPPYLDQSEALRSMEQLAAEGISLPTFVGLTQSQVERICLRIRQFANARLQEPV
ncbi:DegT/DnrJ/EryC1/StrS family aminotransferase [Alkalimonas amylolytica]|uniref:GDP-perosamine synthase n=1 Tax=Alkalimonas amylolytica TaxID=152573 RepID=A0A1H4B8G1_ALKAM|nr:DegT/DnrJ/EryC1/StrS family aminotransferase [Alkalimonas amylolytica]SEA44431.1 perosamine synthetase [Alkalimonas amylolytica]